MLARRGLWTHFGLTFSMSASSFSGNRLAALAALRQRLDDFRARQADLRVTGRGLLPGLHFATPAATGEVIRAFIRDGLLVAAVFRNNRCVLLEPPLVIEQVRLPLVVLAAACEGVAARTAATSASRRGDA